MECKWHGICLHSTLALMQALVPDSAGGHSTSNDSGNKLLLKGSPQSKNFVLSHTQHFKADTFQFSIHLREKKHRRIQRMKKSKKINYDEIGCSLKDMMFFTHTHTLTHLDRMASSKQKRLQLLSRTPSVS